MKDLKDKAVLVTGSASGIGRAAALVFASEGARPLLLNDIDEAGLARTASELALVGYEAFVLPADVSDREAVDAMVDRALDLAGRIDVLVNVAGVVGFCPVEDLEPQDWSYELDVDLWGVINTVGAVYPHMISRGSGHIVNVASSSGLFDPVLYLAPYVTAKFAVVGLSEALMLEARPHGVGVSCVCPGSVKTPIQRGIRIKGFTEGVERLLWPMAAIASRPEDTARSMVRAVTRDRPLVVTTRFARACYFFKRHFPFLWFALLKRFSRVFAFIFGRYRTQPGGDK
jgi:NAD(P)-dependent dehydrogenase (short-subunit alcohol dehydrogenase family)